MDESHRQQAKRRVMPAHTFNEVWYYLLVTPCAACGAGPLEMDPPTGPARDRRPQAGKRTAVSVHCKRCGRRRSFSFLCEHPVPDGDPEAETINPTDEPSRMIDLGQWVSLFHLLDVPAASPPSGPEARRTGLRAALCLAEALKFFTEDDELPPESAFFHESTLAAYKEHPERFARQHLRDMQARLPGVPDAAGGSEPAGRADRPWWQFWKH